MSYQCPCLGCGRPLVLPFRPRRAKLCDACYAPRRDGACLRAADRRRRGFDEVPSAVNPSERALSVRPPPGGRRPRPSPVTVPE